MSTIYTKFKFNFSMNLNNIESKTLRFTTSQNWLTPDDAVKSRNILPHEIQSMLPHTI